LHPALAHLAAELKAFFHESLLNAPSPSPAQRTPALQVLAARSCQSENLSEARFNHLALQLFAIQFQQNPPYRALCLARGIQPERISDWRAIPSAPTSAFKEFAFTCLSPSERTSHFESSGTTRSVRSQCHHNADSLQLYEAALLPWFQRHLLPETWGTPAGRTPAWDFISLTPTAPQAPHSSLVHMLDVVARQPWFDRTQFIGRLGQDGTWHLDFSSLLAATQIAGARNQSLVLAGTAFNWVQLLETPRVEQLHLTAGSRVMETGGYKGRTRELPREQLHAELSTRLGIARDCIVTEYGMTELSSQAYDQVAGSPSTTRTLQFPPWTRVTVVSPETGREVAPGEIGLVRVLDLANAFSVLAVETEDLAVRHDDGIELLGRSAEAQPRGCSRMTA
jgi:hypothetical protein